MLRGGRLALLDHIQNTLNAGFTRAQREQTIPCTAEVQQQAAGGQGLQVAASPAGGRPQLTTARASIQSAMRSHRTPGASMARAQVGMGSLCWWQCS